MTFASGLPRRGPLVRLMSPIMVVMVVGMLVAGCKKQDDPPKPATRPTERTQSQGSATMPVEQPPATRPTRQPRLRIITQCPGRANEELESLVTVKIERALMAIEGIREIRSFTAGKVATIDAVFAPGQETAVVMAMVRAAIRALRADLPEDVAETVVEVLPDPSTLAAVVDIYGDATRTVLQGAAGKLADELKGAIRDDSFIRVTGSHAQGEDELILRTQGQESILVEVFAPTRHEVPSVAKLVQSTVDQLRAQTSEHVEFHVVDCSPATRQAAPVFFMTAECPGIPAKMVAKEVAAPLTAAVRQLKGISYLHTQSSSGRVRMRIELQENQRVPAAMRSVRGVLKDLGGMASQPEPFPPVVLARVDLHGKTVDEMLPSALRLRRGLVEIAGVARVDAPALRPPKPVLQVDVDREKAARYGLSVQTVSSFLKTALSGHETAKQIEDLTIPSHGKVVPLRELVNFRLEALPPVRYRLNGRPTITLDVASDGLTDADRILRSIQTLVEAARKRDASININITGMPNHGGPSTDPVPPTQQAE